MPTNSSRNFLKDIQAYGTRHFIKLWNLALILLHFYGIIRVTTFCSDLVFL